MKLILKNNEFYLLSHEILNVEEYYCTFAVGLRGNGRGWSDPKIYKDSNICKLSRLMQKEHVGKVIASSVKVGDLPLIDTKQITDGDNFVSYMLNFDRFNVNELALEKYPRLINDPYNPMEDDNKEYRDIWISAFNKGKSVNYDRKFTKKQMYDLAFETYLNANVFVNPHAISEFIDKEIKKLDVEKNEWSVEVECEWNPISDFCDECGSGTKKECDNFCKNRQLKINDKGFINILKIK